MKQKRGSRFRIVARVLAMLLVITAAGFAIQQIRHKRNALDLPTAPARKGDFLVLVRTRGELGARRSQQLLAPVNVSDLTIVWLAPPGSAVTSGQAVIRFDPSRLRQDLKEKTAALQQAQASLDQAIAQARITAEQDKLDLSTAGYDMEKARLEVSKKAIVSDIEGKESAIDFGMSEEKLKVQRATVELHKKSDEAKVASLTRLRDQAQAEVDLTTKRLSQMEVKSPLDGVVNYMPNHSQGWMNSQPFKVGDHAWPGGVIAEIPDLTTIQLESRLDEVDRGKVTVGDAVLVRVDAFPEKVWTAKIQSISPLTETSFSDWPPVSSFKAYAQIEKPDKQLRPGMNASGDIVQTKIPNALSIPAKALFTRGGNPVVYVKSAAGYQTVRVRVLARNPDEIAIEGIRPGSLVTLSEPEQEGKKT